MDKFKASAQMKFFFLFCFAACLPELFQKPIDSFEKQQVHSVIGYKMLTPWEQVMANIYRVDNLKISGNNSLKIWLPEASFLTFYRKEVVVGRENLFKICGIPQRSTVKFDVYEDTLPGRYRFVSEEIELESYILDGQHETYRLINEPLRSYHHIVLHGYKKGLNLVMTEMVNFLRRKYLPEGTITKPVTDIKREDKADLLIRNLYPEILVPLETVKKFTLFKTIEVYFNQNFTNKYIGKPYLTSTTLPKLTDLTLVSPGMVIMNVPMFLTAKGKEIPVIPIFVVSIQESTPKHVIIHAQKLWKLRPLHPQDTSIVQEAKDYFDTVQPLQTTMISHELMDQ